MSVQQARYENMLHRSWLDEQQYKDGIMIKQVFTDDFLSFFCAINTNKQLEADDSIENLVESGHEGLGVLPISMSGLIHM